MIVRIEILDFDRATLEAPTPKKTAWDNLVVSAKAQNPTLAVLSTVAWLSAHPEKTLSDLDRELRAQKVPLRLFGKKPSEESEQQVFVDPRDVTRQVGHLLMASCRPEEHADAEVEEHWPSIEDNYRVLDGDTGVAMTKVVTGRSRGMYEFENDAARDALREDIAHLKVGDEAPNNLMLITMNLIRIVEAPRDVGMSMEEHINRVTEAYTASTGKRPSTAVVGMRPEGPVIAFKTAEGDAFLTDVGVVITHKEDGQQSTFCVSLREL